MQEPNSIRVFEEGLELLSREGVRGDTAADDAVHVEEWVEELEQGGDMPNSAGAGLVWQGGRPHKFNKLLQCHKDKGQVVVVVPEDVEQCVPVAIDWRNSRQTSQVADCKVLI